MTTLPLAANNHRLEFVLRLADNCLILSQRLGEWCGHGPELEEDMALTNIALDLNGQAQNWLEYGSELEGEQRTPDMLAFLRDAGEFRNCLLLEQPNQDFAYTTARQFYFDTWHNLVLTDLLNSTDQRIREISEKSLKEVRYHLRHSSGWVIRLGDGTDESNRRMQKAIDDLWGYTGELLTSDAIDDTICAERIGPDLTKIRTDWLTAVQAVLTDATLQVPESGWMHTGGKQGIHTEALGYLLAEMQFLQRAYPGAQW
ncbi:MAG: phenylacetate-CoA oxygenase subunit PaaC [Verrucomicrobia bacterium]|nr:phenylacetate-CoA oxygenase subunit PaaC [Verrucomicrobiota bacterium]